MQTRELTRREFVMSSAGLLLAPTLVAGQGGAAVTARQIADRIRANGGANLRPNTVDGIKAGDPATVVTGIVTTTVATMDVLRRAAAAKQNFIVTHEPTFYGANDDPGARATDPVYLAKKKFIDDQQLVVYRLFDQWNATPEKSAHALAQSLGFMANFADSRLFGVPQDPRVTLGALADLVRRVLRASGGIRVVGPSSMTVQRVFIATGTTTLATTMAALNGKPGSVPAADVVIAGEPREWEAVPYVFDTAAAGRPKGMIALGRVVSEVAGMRAAADWIRSFVPEVPVATISTPDPYWSARA